MIMTRKEYIEKLNDLEQCMRDEKEDVYEMYGDHSDDAELCWDQFRKRWDDEIDSLVEEAQENGVPVWYDSDRREWVLKERRI